MAAVVTDNRDRSRFEIRVDGAPAGFSAYQLEDDRIVFTHTEVDDAFEGQGLGSTLASEALDAARDTGLGVVPKCPFIAGYIRRHPEYADLVPEDVRFDVGL